MSGPFPENARIAVVGGGVAGIVSAYLLQRRYDVTLYESAARLGGHTNTVRITSGPDAGLCVDTGFIVLNDKNYPYFTAFLEQLKVPTRYSDMSFSYECRDSGFAYAGTNLNGLFAQRSNLYSRSFYKLLFEIARFCNAGQKYLVAERQAEGQGSSLTLGEFLDRGGYSQLMRDSYLLPMGAAIWSAPPEDILHFPVTSLLSFFSNHGLLSLRDRPRWQTVQGGSHSYVERFAETFRGRIMLSANVERIASDATGTQISVSGRGAETYAGCVIATHSDQALRLLADADSLERELLGAWRYQPNRTVLHTDSTHLPINRRAWASWNYTRETSSEGNRPVSVTYHMNRLQGLTAQNEYCVSLNPVLPIAPDRVIAEILYEHPMYDSASVQTHPRLHTLQGRRGRYFAGSYFGHGFHEDAVRSAVQVGKLLGAPL